MIKPWRTEASRTLVQTPIFRLDAHRRVSDSGRAGEFVVMSTADWINVVAITQHRELVMIEQYRHGTARPTLEIPGGMVDPADPSPADAARRELLEETGYAAERMIQIGVVEPNPAIQGNRCYTFLAEGAARVAEPALDPHEEIEIRLEPVARARALVQSGAITHALVVAAFHWWALHEGRP